MEKVTFRNSRNHTLVGNLYHALSKSIIIMCHGFTSDKSSRGRFDRFADTFHQHSYNVLAFDFSGCGESDDDRLTMSKQIDDLQSAISFVKKEGYKDIALHGHSLGTKICLSCYQSGIKTMVLTGALTGPIKYNWEEVFSAAQLEELSQKGYITEARSEGIRKKVEIDGQMLLDFELGSQKELLEKVLCPVLIVHGNGDDEERRLYEISRKGMKWLPKQSELVVIENAPHSFTDHLEAVEGLAIDWYVDKFPLN